MCSDVFRTRLADYILSGHAFIHVSTAETTRCLAVLKTMTESLSDDDQCVFTLSHAVGWRDRESKLIEGVQFGLPDSQKVAREILELPEESLFVLRVFGFYLNTKTYSYADLVIAWLCEIHDVLANIGRTILFVGPDLDVPASLADDVACVSLPLPRDTVIKHSVRFVSEGRSIDDAKVTGGIRIPRSRRDFACLTT